MVSVYLAYDLYFFFKVTFYLVNAHFFPFLSRKKNKEIGERKKKKDRGRFLTARRKFAQKQERILGTKASAKAGEYFGLFSLEKSFDGVEKKYSRVIPVYVRTRYTVSRISTKMLVKHSHFRGVLGRLV